MFGKYGRIILCIINVLTFKIDQNSVRICWFHDNFNSEVSNDLYIVFSNFVQRDFL